MAEHWKDGDPIPEGLTSDTTLDAAVMAISGSLAAHAGVLSAAEMEGMFDGWIRSVEANGPETTAGLLMAIATLAASAYANLGDLTDRSPLDVMQADAAMAEAFADLAKSLREGR